MNILLTGGTGFIGTYLVRLLIEKGHKCTILTRSPKKYTKQVTDQKTFRHIGDEDSLQALVNSSDVIINLAGENLFDQKWSEEIKQRIVASRVDITQTLAAAIARSKTPPKVFVSASAVGIYGSRGDEKLDEDSSLADDFLAEVCKKWETAADGAREHTRVVHPRIGIALEKDGGALQKMLLPFKLFAGGPLGNGQQFFPWIHMQDLTEALYYVITEAKFSGAFNLTAPQPVRMQEFAKALGKALGRPAVFSVPEFALKLSLGEAAEAILASQRVYPKVLLDAGFRFQHEEVYQALQQITK